MATEFIISDAGTIYKRLLNHRPIIQNEVHYFVKEFETKREDGDLRSIQDAMKNANEMDAVYLEDINAESAKFRQVMTKIEDISKQGNDFLDGERSTLTISGEEYDQFDQQVEECRKRLQEKQKELDLKTEQEVERLKKEIQSVREDRNKLRSVTSSSASVTIYPPSTPSSDGVRSNEDSLSGSPDSSKKEEEVKSSRGNDNEKTEVTSAPDESIGQDVNHGSGGQDVNHGSGGQDGNHGEPESVSEVTQE